MARRAVSLCRECTERAAGASMSQEQMAELCRQCKYLKKMESPGMTVIPVYAMETLAELVENGQPILGRSGIIL